MPQHSSCWHGMAGRQAIFDAVTPLPFSSWLVPPQACPPFFIILLDEPTASAPGSCSPRIPQLGAITAVDAFDCMSACSAEYRPAGAFAVTVVYGCVASSSCGQSSTSLGGCLQKLASENCSLYSAASGSCAFATTRACRPHTRQGTAAQRFQKITAEIASRCRRSQQGSLAYPQRHVWGKDERCELCYRGE